MKTDDTVAPSPVVWINGVLQPARQAALLPTERGFLLADGLFETMRVADRQVPHLDLHWDRLMQGCTVLGLLSPDLTVVRQALAAVIHANGVVDGSVRLTWTRGTGPRGLMPSGSERPTLLITANASARHSAGGEPGVTPLRLMTCTRTRRNEVSPLSRIKTLNYGDNLLARQEAAAAGADDAILLNCVGLVAETSVASLFVRLGGQWLTPRVEDGALPGIRRALALRRGLAVEAPITPTALQTADAMVLTNALSARPVTQYDGRVLSGLEDAVSWAQNSLID